MPNWCENILDLSGNRNKLIAFLEKIVEEDTFFDNVVKMPKELLIPPDNPEESARRTSLYNQTGWHEWRLENWGTKWDVRPIDIYDFEELFDRLKNSTETDDTISLSFDTAWNPPVGIFAALEKLGFSVQAYYYERGEHLYGDYSDGCNNRCGYARLSQIPKEFVDMFGIDLADDDNDDEFDDE